MGSMSSSRFQSVGERIHDHLWDQRVGPFTVRRGRGLHKEQIGRPARREHERFTQVRAARMRKTLLLLSLFATFLSSNHRSAHVVPAATHAEWAQKDPLL